jgi:hypothetical protein
MRSRSEKRPKVGHDTKELILFLAALLPTWLAYFAEDAVIFYSLVAVTSLAISILCLSHEGWRLAWRIVAVAAVLIAFGLISCRFYETHRRRDLVVAERHDLSKQLSDRLYYGLNIQQRFGDNGQFPTEDEVNKWAADVLNVLNKSTVATGYPERFNSADSQIGMEGIALVGHNQAETARYVFVVKRLATLREFVKELSQ